jgi:hypothetical protein
MYKKKDRKFIKDKLPEKSRWMILSGKDWDDTFYGKTYRRLKERVAKGDGRYERLSRNFLRRFKHVQKKRFEEEVRTDEICQYYGVKYTSWKSLETPWDDHLAKGYCREKRTWKRHTKCRKQWQKKLD